MIKLNATTHLNWPPLFLIHALQLHVSNRSNNSRWWCYFGIFPPNERKKMKHSANRNTPASANTIQMKSISLKCVLKNIMFWTVKSEFNIIWVRGLCVFFFVGMCRLDVPHRHFNLWVLCKFLNLHVKQMIYNEYVIVIVGFFSPFI